MRAFLIAISVVGGGGCAYYSLKSPEVVPKGNGEVGVGLGVVNLTHKIETEDTTIVEEDTSFTGVIPLFTLGLGRARGYVLLLRSVWGNEGRKFLTLCYI
jgi:hypothetical protein